MGAACIKSGQPIEGQDETAPRFEQDISFQNLDYELLSDRLRSHLHMSRTVLRNIFKQSSPQVLDIIFHFSMDLELCTKRGDINIYMDCSTVLHSQVIVDRCELHSDRIEKLEDVVKKAYSEQTSHINLVSIYDPIPDSSSDESDSLPPPLSSCMTQHPDHYNRWNHLPDF